MEETTIASTTPLFPSIGCLVPVSVSRAECFCNKIASGQKVCPRTGRISVCATGVHLRAERKRNVQFVSRVRLFSPSSSESAIATTKRSTDAAELGRDGLVKLTGNGFNRRIQFARPLPWWLRSNKLDDDRWQVEQLPGRAPVASVPLVCPLLDAQSGACGTSRHTARLWRGAAEHRRRRRQTQWTI